MVGLLNSETKGPDSSPALCFSAKYLSFTVALSNQEPV